MRKKVEGSFFHEWDKAIKSIPMKSKKEIEDEQIAAIEKAAQEYSSYPNHQYDFINGAKWAKGIK